MAFQSGDITELRILPIDPSERRLWVVSSLDGNLDKLEEAISEIEGHQHFCKDDKVIFMGNFIGTGLDNRKIIQTLREYQKERHPQVAILRGANEHRFLSSRKSFFETEIGTSLLNSYREKDKFFKQTCNIKRLLEDRDWILTLPSIYRTKRFFFVHQGVVDKQDLKSQNPLITMFLSDLSFIQHNKKYEKIIVHTHTENEYKSNRIGINTGLIVLNDTKETNDILEINA